MARTAARRARTGPGRLKSRGIVDQVPAPRESTTTNQHLESEVHDACSLLSLEHPLRRGRPSTWTRATDSSGRVACTPRNGRDAARSGRLPRRQPSSLTTCQKLTELHSRGSASAVEGSHRAERRSADAACQAQLTNTAAPVRLGRDRCDPERGGDQGARTARQPRDRPRYGSMIPPPGDLPDRPVDHGRLDARPGRSGDVGGTNRHREHGAGIPARAGPWCSGTQKRPGSRTRSPPARRRAARAPTLSSRASGRPRGSAVTVVRSDGQPVQIASNKGRSGVATRYQRNLVHPDRR